MYLADTSETSGLIDPFKTMNGKLPKKNEVVEKINLASQYSTTGEGEVEGPGYKKAHNYKWTTIEN